MSLTHERMLNIARNISETAAAVEHHGDYTITVPMDHLIDVLTELKEHPEASFNQLVDVTAIDWLRKGDRYEVVYFLYSIANGVHLRVKVAVNEHKPHVPTAVDIWEGANWYERETYDMYGIIFDGHPDLRRFYMPEDFMDESGEQLYPLRKDFPLGGIPGSLPLPPKTEIVRN